MPLIILAALLGAIGLLERAGFVDLHLQARVVEVWAGDEGRTLEVVIDTCNADVSVAIEEHSDRVVLRAARHDRRFVVTGDDDCQDLVQVTLAVLLGDRVVQGSGGNEFAVDRR